MPEPTGRLRPTKRFVPGHLRKSVSAFLAHGEAASARRDTLRPPRDSLVIRFTPAARGRLVELVGSSGMTPARLARGARVRRDVLEDLLSGQRTTVCPAVLARIAGRLGAFPGWIVFGVTTPEEARCKRIRECREGRKLTMQDLAMQARVSSRTVMRMEIDPKHRPQRESLERVALALGVPIDYLQYGKMEERPPEADVSARRTHTHALLLGASMMLFILALITFWFARAAPR